MTTEDRVLAEQKRIEESSRCAVVNCKRPAVWIGTNDGVETAYCAPCKHYRRTLITNWRER